MSSFTVRAQGEIQVYFNHLENSSYTDPYRGITRKGENLEEVIVSEILKARKSVNIAVQEIRLPRIAKALVSQAKKGVKVRLVLENSYHNTIVTMKEPKPDDDNQHEYSKYIELFSLVDEDGNGRISKRELNQRDAVHMLTQNGIPLKDDTYDGSMGSALMHHKFVVIDGKTVILTTANFTVSDMHGDLLKRSTRGNANSLLKMRSADLAKIFNEEFFQMWGGKTEMRTPRFGNQKTYRGPQTARLGETKIVAQFSPTSRGMDWNKSVNGLIGKVLGQAKHEVLMALFVFSDQKLADILQKKHAERHGFKLGLLIEPVFAYRYYSEMLDIWGLSLLNEYCVYEQDNNPWNSPALHVGVPNLPRGDMLHHKFAVVDRETVIVGSQNWSDSANYQNDENVLAIKNQEIASAYAREFERLEKNSRHGPTKTLLDKIEMMEQACR